MKLKNLEIYNVGPYRERNMFSFIDSSIDKPIILIRGHNGAGKTHVFDSIRYCLFGNRVLNGSKEQDFLSDFTYKPKDENFKLTDSSSYVELTIEDPIENSEFTIKRGWKKNKEIDSILELEIRGEGEDATVKIKDQDAQNYIDRLIPYNYSELFFYDGEEAKRRFKGKDSKELFNLIDSIFGIAVIDQSIQDIKKIQRDLVKNADISKEYEILIKEFNKLEKEEILQSSKIYNLETSIEKTSFKIKEIDKIKDQLYSKFKALGGEYLKDLDKNHTKLLKINEKSIVLKEKLKRLSEKTIPLIFCPTLQADLDKLYKERKLESDLDTFKEFLKKAKVREVIRNESIQLDLNEISINDISDDKDFHLNIEISNHAKNKELDIIKKCFDDILSNLADEESTRNEINSVPIYVPDEIRKIKKHESRLIPLLAKKEKMIIELDILSALNDKTNKSKDVFLKKIKIGKDEDQKVKTEKALEVLLKYRSRIYDSKDKLLRQNLIDRISLLARKKELIKDIDINYKKKLVVYKDRNNRRIPKFSAGENHIISVAWIWALSDLSSKKIPFVIDTPMGSGLDELHRKNLIEIFLKKLSKQTIVLSNDDEIDDTSANLLKEIVSTTYRISNVGDETSIREVDG
tara:strand:- start:7298 stop:9196 length:1899 start_codon:yes stop_codon:yes gene_type:complete